MLTRNKYRKIYRGYDSELAYEVSWIIYNVEDFTLFERQRLYNLMKEMKDLNHPNVLKYMHVNLNNESDEILAITELAGTLKEYLRKLSHPKVKVIRLW